MPDNRETETPVKNPAYVEFAPCPCDLTKGLCDNNCCCDGVSHDMSGPINLEFLNEKCEVQKQKISVDKNR